MWISRRDTESRNRDRSNQWTNLVDYRDESLQTTDVEITFTNLQKEKLKLFPI